MEILDVVPDNEADFWEREYIQNFRERGFDLTNCTDGGFGTFGYTFSAEACARRSAAVMGENNPGYGKKQSPEVIAKRVEQNTGQKRTLQQCETLRRGVTGVKHKNNTSGFVGVFWNKKNRNWRADFQLNKKKKYVGGFKKIEDAVFARALALILCQ